MSLTVKYWLSVFIIVTLALPVFVLRELCCCVRLASGLRVEKKKALFTQSGRVCLYMCPYMSC